MEIVRAPVRAKSTSRYICAVKGCNSKSNKNLDLFFHTFPKPGRSVVQIENIFGNYEKLDRLEAWKRVLKVKNVTTRMTVCSLHFNESDYIFPNYKLRRKKLKKSAVPSRNLPCSKAAKKTHNLRKNLLESITHDHGSYEYGLDTNEKKLEILNPVLQEQDQINVSVSSSYGLLQTDDNITKDIIIKQEEEEVTIEEFDAKKYIVKLPTNLNEDNITKNIDITCVKQETDNSIQSNEINLEPAEDDLQSTQNTVSSNDKSIININTNFTQKESEKKSSENIKVVDLKRVLHTPQHNIETTINFNKICVLCAGTDNSNSKSITRFAKMILDLSGVDILNIGTSPIACGSCLKQLKMVENVKKQIMYTNNLRINAIIPSINISDVDFVKGKKRSKVWDDSDDSSEAEDRFPFETIQRKITTENIFHETNSKKENSSSDTWDDDNDDVENLDKTINKESVKKSKKRNKRKRILKERSYLCEECGIQYKTLDRLKTHLETIHRERKHLCHICGKAFNSRLLLTNHFRTHSGEKPFTCTHCNKKFSLKWNLDQHKRQHSDSLPYKCKLCLAAFRYNLSLKSHIVKSHSAAECAKSSETITDVQISTNEEAAVSGANTEVQEK